MSKTKIPKFLMSAFNMVKRGDIKNIDDLFKFAKQEFGEITSSLKNQIEDTFKKGQAAAITEKRTKDMSRGDPTGEGLSQFRKNIEELKKQMEELDKLDDRNKDITKDLQDALTGQIFKRPMGSTDATKPFKTPGMPFQRENPNYRLPGGSMYAEGNLRTAIREFLKTEHKAGNLKLDETDLFRITEYSPRSIDDPIDVFRRYYGEDALEAADAMASKLEKGTSFKNYEEIFRANMPELKIKTEGAGQYDQSIADAEAALKQGAEDKKNLEILEDFDVEGRKKNNMGGINRASFASGKIKLAVFLAGKGKNLTDEIRKAVDNIFPSGDRKVDADVALDNMYEELGIDRDVVDMKDDMKAYGEAYDLLSVPRGSRGGPDDIAAPFSSEKVELPKGVKPEDTILPTGSLISKRLKTMRIADEIQPGLFENLTDKQTEIIEKYGELVDMDLLKNIVLDPDPNNQAAALATLEEAMVLMKKGVGPDEAIDILKKGSRTKQAEGGLSYLMGM
jgi:DNA-binding transcriptional MerR regulator